MTLLIALPSAASPEPTPKYRYAVSSDGQTVSSQGNAPAALLPRGQGEVVAVLPAQAISWHRLKLPHLARGTSPARLRAILGALLEEQLLDDPQTLHIALEAGRHTGQPAGHAVWAACCDKAWLTQSLQQLEQEGLAPSRLLSSTHPLAAGEIRPHVLLSGTTDQPLLQVSTGSGVWLLPVRTGDEVRHTLSMLGLQPAVACAAAPIPAEVNPNTVAHSPSSTLPHAGDGCEAPTALTSPVYQTEPAVAALAEKWSAHPPGLRSIEQGWLQAFASDEDLAQFDLSLSASSHTLRRWRKRGARLLHAPEWRPARIGLMVLVAAQLLGLNVWAWVQHRHLQQAQQDVRQLLTQTFPQTHVVIDAPRQMAREVSALRQSAGQTSPQDLEAMLAALAAVLPTGRPLQHLAFTPGELQFAGPGLSAEDQADVQDKLKPYGLRLHPSGDSQWTLTAGLTP